MIDMRSIFYWSFHVFAAAFLGANVLSAANKNARSDAQFEKSILHLSVTRAIPDPESPWAVQNTDVSGHAGVVVAENRVLTQASLVSRAVYIQAQKVDDVEKIPMRIVFADFEANLALLEPAPGFALRGAKILPVGPDIPVGSDVTLVAIENERQLQRVDLRAMDVSIREATIGGMTVPMYSLAGQSRNGCKSDLIIRKSMLVGLCVGTAENQPLAITAGVISHFLADKMSKDSYRGFGSFGATLHPVRSPWHRKLLGIAPGKGALRVAGIFETSPFSDCLAVDDVLTGIDQVAVDHRGFFKHSQWGPVPIRHYVISKYAGDSITLKFNRMGGAKSCTRVLRRYFSQDLAVPGLTSEGRVAHLIFAGMLFRELNGDFLSSFGREWQRNSPPALSFIYTYMNQPSLTRRRQLVLSNVLGDAINAGYEKLSNLLLESVNGRSATSIDELKVHLKMPGIQRDGLEYAQFDFKGGIQIALPYKSISEAHKRIAKTYSVTDPSSFFSRGI